MKWRLLRVGCDCQDAAEQGGPLQGLQSFRMQGPQRRVVAGVERHGFLPQRVLWMSRTWRADMSFPAVIRTPVPCWVASRVRISRVRLAHPSTRSRCSASQSLPGPRLRPGGGRG
jgi:hypothetical protein